jgi:hypothetical protein
MSRDTTPTVEDDLRNDLDEDDRAAIIAYLRARGFADDAEDWLGLA